MRAGGPGDRVVISFFPSWIAGDPDMAKFASALGGPGDGVLRDTVTIAEEALAPLPPSVSTETAAALPCVAPTAWSAVVEQGAVRPGSVVVTQGTGGVSLFALQFAKRLGARVVATTSSEAKAERLAELGADPIVNYRREADWTKRARNSRAARSTSSSRSAAPTRWTPRCVSSARAERSR